jgi:hypothetical protein
MAMTIPLRPDVGSGERQIPSAGGNCRTALQTNGPPQPSNAQSTICLILLSLWCGTPTRALVAELVPVAFLWRRIWAG